MKRVKGQVGGSARFVLAAYRSEVSDQQLTTLVELDDGRTASLLTNAGKTRVLGVEAELGLALTQRLSLDLSYAWTDARYRDLSATEQADLLGSDGSAADTARLGSVAGNRLPRVPVHMASAVLGYRWQLQGLGEAYLGADWSYESSRFAQEHNFIRRPAIDICLGCGPGSSAATGT